MSITDTSHTHQVNLVPLLYPARFIWHEGSLVLEKWFQFLGLLHDVQIFEMV